MTDTLVLKSGLKMPSSFVEVKDDEMEYVDGGAWNIVVGVIMTVVGVILSISSALCSYFGNNGAALGLAIAGTVISTIGGFLCGLGGGKDKITKMVVEITINITRK